LATFIHRTADFDGVSATLLRDGPLISGLVVAAAGAAGLSASAAPAVRSLGADGVSAILALEAEGGHIAVHTFPDKKLLLFDVLAPNTRETEKAIDVFVRRLGARGIRKSETSRGAG
jgi:S-adenosylmethionine/arginine decarboxylase-like enzyme